MKQLNCKKTFVACALFAIASVPFITAGCKKPAAEKKEADTEVIVYAVNCLKVSEGNLDEYIEQGGDVDSVNAVNVLPDMSGKISGIVAKVGQYVTKNQVIAYVDASRPGYDFSESPVKAPIAGRITAITPTIGTMVSQSTSVAKISNTEDLEIKINIPERFIGRIKENQKVEISFDAYPGEIFEATVSEISPVLDTTTRTMQTKVNITQRDNKIKIGMYAKAKLITNTVNNIVIPSSAIVYRDGAPYIFKIDSDAPALGQAKVKICAVTEGITVDDKTEVTGGISSGDVIVVKGQGSLNDGSSVNVISIAE